MYKFLLILSVFLDLNILLPWHFLITRKILESSGFLLVVILKASIVSSQAFLYPNDCQPSFNSCSMQERLWLGTNFAAYLLSSLRYLIKFHSMYETSQELIMCTIRHQDILKIRILQHINYIFISIGSRFITATVGWFCH